MSHVVSPTRMSCTISSELLAELDEACYQNRVNRSEFVREVLATYLEQLRAQNHKINAANNEEALVA